MGINRSIIVFLTILICSCEGKPQSEQINGTMKIEKKKINKTERDSLIRQFEGKIESEISERIYPLKAMILNDGRVILIRNDGGMLYDSKSDVFRTLNTPVQVKEPAIDENFLTQIPSLIEKLSDLINLPLSMQDTLNGLEKVDSVIHQRGIENISEEDYLLPMVAYSGQVMINEIGGMWEVRRENEGEAKLYIKGPNKKLYDLYYPIREMIVNQEGDFSLAGEVSYQIKPFKLKSLGGKDE